MSTALRPSLRDSLSHHSLSVARAFVVVGLVAWFVFAALVLALRYAVLPKVSAYRPSIEAMASRALGETVTIGSIDASWRGLRPSLALRSVRIVDASGRTTLELPAVDATLSWQSLVVMDLRLSRLEIDGPQLAITRDASGQIFVAGRPIRRKEPHDDRLAEWVLSQDTIRVRHARLEWRDELRGDGADDADTGATPPPREVALSDVDLVLERAGWRHRFALRATPPPRLAAPVDVRASIEHGVFARLSDTADWRGTIYANVASADIGLWRDLVRLPPSIEHGRGRVRSWVRFTDASTATSVANASLGRSDTTAFLVLGRIAEITADLALDDLAVRERASVRVALASVDGRIAATQDATRQTLAASRLVLRPVGGAPSAPTELAARRTLGHETQGESGEATINAVDIAALLALLPPGVLPATAAEKVAAYRPTGLLDRLALQWSGPVANPESFAFEGRFARLSLAAQPPSAAAIEAASRTIVGPNGLVRKPRPAFGQPGFENLSGTLRADRSGAADARTTSIEIDVASTDATIVAPGLFDDPRLRLARLEAAVGARLAGDDVEVTVRKGVLENADLAGTIELTFGRGPKAGSPRGRVDIDARLSRANVARVPRYLPNVIGERARLYLSKALVSGDVVDATFRMKGTLEQLDVRAQADSLAVENPAQLAATLVAVRDRGARPAGPSVEVPPPRPDNDSILHAVVKVKNATYLYGPGRTADEVAAAAAAAGTPLAQPPQPSPPWPAFHDVDADVIFDHATMRVAARAARYEGFRLTDITVDLPAIADPAHVLRATGRGTGPLNDLVRYVNASPIARWTRNAFAGTQAKGTAGFALALDLPLGHARDAEVVGSIDLAHDDLAVNAQVPPLTNLVGRVDFTDKAVSATNVTGEVLGGPIRIDASARGDSIEIKANGTVDARALRAGESAKDDAFGAPRIVERLAHRIDGTASYNADIRLRSKRLADAQRGAPTPPSQADLGAPDVVVTSDLRGLSIALPAPFDKAADDAWPTRIELRRSPAPADGAVRSAGNASARDGDDLRVVVGDRLALEIERHRNPQGQLAVTRAHYAVGAATAAGAAVDGVSVVVPMLDLDAWRDVAKDLATPPGEPPAPGAPNAALAASLVPSRIAIDTPLLRVASRTFDDVHVAARRVADGWEADATSRQVAGRLSYKDVTGTASNRSGIAKAANGRLVARLSHLSIPKGEASASHVKDALDASRERDFPAIDLVAERFELRGRELGRLEVVAENTGDDAQREWKVERALLTTPETRFAANGTWSHGAAGERTRLAFTLDSSNVGQLLDRLGVYKTIRDGSAKLSGNVGWDGGPTTIDYASMNGRLALDAGKGQFLKADPGIAKLLGVLSLQSIPRRLLLDFSDVFEAGFAFDAITADVTVDAGMAATDDFKMRGVQANVLMSGTADLAHETTDLHVLVLPQINAGAASLGYALVNPAIGLATFVAQYLFKDPIARALSFEYNVSGPWNKPVVVKIDHDGNVKPVRPKALREPASAAAATAAAESR